MFNLTNIQKGIFMLFLSVSGNFISETLSCKTQKLLNNNMYAKQIIMFCMLYFIIGFIDDTNQNPIEHLKYSALIWVAFLLFTKMHLIPTIIAFLLVCICYIINNYGIYYKNQGDTEKGDKYTEIAGYIAKINCIFILVSFLFYLFSKYREYNKDFNILKFIFGNVICKNN